MGGDVVRVVSGQDVWPAIEEAALRRGRSKAGVAVAYLTKDMLGLRAGDLLVVNLENDTCRAGQTNPAVVRDIWNRGVRVFRSADLHAKIMVFGDTVVVGSTNFSESSRHRYREAASITRSRSLATDVLEQIENLGDIEVSDADLDAAQAVWRPPKGGGGGSHGRQVGPETPVTGQDRLWIVATGRVDAPRTVTNAAAQRRHRRSRGFEVGSQH